LSAEDAIRPRVCRRGWLGFELMQAGWQSLRARWARRRIEANTRAELHGLDERDLRDLGLDRSQIPSIAASVARRIGVRVPDALV